jgi:hypothetical protein
VQLYDPEVIEPDGVNAHARSLASLTTLIERANALETLRTVHEQAQGKGDQGAFDVWNAVAEALGSHGDDRSPRPLTREEIMRAVNTGTDLATEAMGNANFVSGDQAYNIANLVVNAIGTVLDHADEVSMADVLADNFDESSMPDYRQELGDDVVDQALELRKEAGNGDDR